MRRQQEALTTNIQQQSLQTELPLYTNAVQIQFKLALGFF